MATTTNNSDMKSVDELRRWLRPTEYLSPGNEYAKHLNSYVTGTGDWLRDSEEFRQWEDGAKSACLWVRGVPGSGKSVFSAATVKILAETQDREGRKSPVLFFFFRQIVEKNHDPRFLVRDWTAQLLPFSTDLQEELSRLSQVSDVDGSELTTLWDALVKAMEALKKVYCVADALDEMDDQHAAFIQKLVQLGVQNPANIKVLLTSRPIPRLENRLGHPSIEAIKLVPAQICPDIASYISSRLDTVEPRLGKEREAQVKETICERSGGLFLYARLTMDSLVDGLREGEIVEDTLTTSLVQLPQDLSEIYARMLAEHAKRTGLSQEQQATIVQCVIQSSRPMRLIELGSIVPILMDDATMGLAEGKEVVRQACGRYLEMLEDESISVIHHSFTEFARGQSQRTDSGSFPVVDEKQAHSIMLKISLHYLNACTETPQTQIEDDDNEDEYNEDDLFFGGWSYRLHHAYPIHQTEDKEIRHLRFIYPFMAYAAENLSYHIRNVESSNDFKLLDIYFAPGQNAFELWIKTVWLQHHNSGVQPLHIAALYGFTAYVRHLITSGSAIDAPDAQKRTALSYAAQGGNADIVSLLLANGADPDVPCDAGTKPLHVAVDHRQPDIVRLLLMAGASPKTAKTKNTFNQLETTNTEETLFRHACLQGNIKILTQFTEYMDIDDACRCLHWAVCSCDPEAVSAILETGKAPIDVLVGGLSALARSVKYLAPAIVKLLLQNGANPNLRVQAEDDFETESAEGEIKLESDTKDGPTTMHLLAGFGSRNDLPWYQTESNATECMKLLVDAGGDVNSTSVNNYTPLHYAVKKGFGEQLTSSHQRGFMAELFLQHGADPKARCNSGDTPLHEVNPELPIVIDLLIQAGADVNARNDAQSTPLLTAVKRIIQHWVSQSQCETIRKLLQYGADVTAENEHGQTALHIMFDAMRSKSDFEDRSLWMEFINAGADLNKPNKNGEQPKHAMGDAQYDPANHDILQFLIDKGLQLDITYTSDYRVLFGLVKIFSEDFDSEWGEIQKYLNLGYSIDLRDENGATILHHCIVLGADWRMFKKLVEAGADPIAIDNDGNTLLHTAAWTHHDSRSAIARRMLVDMGVPTNTQNNVGMTPLHIACGTIGDRINTGEISRHSHPDSLASHFLDFLLNGRLCPTSNLDIVDNFGASPIHYAASMSEFYVGRLLKAGADATLKTKEGLTPLHIAARGRQSNIICALLLEYRKSGTLSSMIDATDDSSRTALHYACRSGRPESVSYLLSAGADFSLRDNHGRTPLHALAELEEEKILWAAHPDRSPSPSMDAACILLGDLKRPYAALQEIFQCASSNFVRAKDIIEMFELAGDKLEAMYLTAGENGKAFTLMDLAVQAKCPELVNELRQRGLSAHDRVAEGLIPRPGGIDQAKTLLERPVSPQFDNCQAVDDGRSRNSEHRDKFEEILEQRDYNLFIEFVNAGGDLLASGRESWDYHTGLHLLVKWGHARLLEIFLDDTTRLDHERWMQEENNPGSLLCYASEQELPRLEVMKVLVEKVKVDVNYVFSYYGYACKRSKATALHLLSYGCHCWNIEAIEYLLDHGANIEARNERGETPLMTAVGTDYPKGFWKEETMLVLLKRGANPNVLCNQGRSCLSMADHAKVTRILLDHGAKIDNGNPHPLVSAVDAMDADIAKLLLATSFDKYKLDLLLYEAAVVPSIRYEFASMIRHRRQLEMISLLLEKGADPFSILSEGSSVIQKLIEDHGVLDLFWCLPNFDVDLRGEGGRTPLISACFPKPPLTEPKSKRRNTYGDKKLPQMICNLTAAYKLLAMQANVTAVDDLGRTALHWMCTAPNELDDSHQALFTDLIRRAPDIIYQNDNAGFTPLQIAISNSHLHHWIMSHLMSLGCNIKDRDPTGNTVLHYLAARLIGEKTQATAAADKFESFLLSGIPIDQRNNTGATPLSCFISTAWLDTKGRISRYYNINHLLKNDISHVMALDIFLRSGANLQVQNNRGETLLHLAAAQRSSNTKRVSWTVRQDQEEDTLQIFEDLMRRGLDPRAEDTKGRSAIDIAVARGNTFLLELFGPKERQSVKNVTVEDTDEDDDDDGDSNYG